MGDWINPNENVLRIRMTEARFADDFIKYGRIKFSTPQSWIDYSKKHGDGRGDFYEGTLAFCHMYDIEEIVELDKKYDSDNILSANKRPLAKSLYNTRLLYKDERALSLPCYCLYILRIDAFSNPKGIGKQKLTASIDGSYFRDFVDNQTVSQVEARPEGQKPALIIISDFGSFKKRLIETLSGIGVSESDILIQYVAYFDFDKYGDNGWYDFQQQYPKELFIKNKRFDKQSEGRIIINNRKPEVLQRLQETIDLGCMDDIASVYKGYFPDGITIELSATVFQQ